MRPHLAPALLLLAACSGRPAGVHARDLPPCGEAVVASDSARLAGLVEMGLLDPDTAYTLVEAAARPEIESRIAISRALERHYPPTLRSQRIAGEVQVIARIDDRGVPQRVRVGTSSGYPELDEAAVAAFREARFIPAVTATCRVSTTVGVPLRFQPPVRPR